MIEVCDSISTYILIFYSFVNLLVVVIVVVIIFIALVVVVVVVVVVVAVVFVVGFALFVFDVCISSV